MRENYKIRKKNIELYKCCINRSIFGVNNLKLH